MTADDYRAVCALLAEAEHRARERGCHQLVLESAHFRTRAHAFYEREGMTDAAKAFVKQLQPATTLNGV